jgi:hypothetical protein
VVETRHFDVLVTIDKNIRYQQNVTGRNIAILIIRSASNDLECASVIGPCRRVQTSAESSQPHTRELCCRARLIGT